MMLRRLQRNLAIEAVASLAVIGLAWIYGVRPIALEAAEVSIRVEQVDRAIAVHATRANGRPVSAAALESRVEATQADLRMRGDKLPDTRTLYRRLSDLADASGVRIDHVEPGPTAEVRAGVRTLTYRVRCTGSYEQVAEFAREVISGPGASGYSRLSEISLQRGDDGAVECSFDVFSVHPAFEREERTPA
ncbi:MAG: hypothetical protein AAGG07_12995 [Planctomycetota bacterium]